MLVLSLVKFDPGTRIVFSAGLGREEGKGPDSPDEPNLEDFLR